MFLKKNLQGKKKTIECSWFRLGRGDAGWDDLATGTGRQNSHSGAAALFFFSMGTKAGYFYPLYSDTEPLLCIGQWFLKLRFPGEYFFEFEELPTVKGHRVEKKPSCRRENQSGMEINPTCRLLLASFRLSLKWNSCPPWGEGGALFLTAVITISIVRQLYRLPCTFNLDDLFNRPASCLFTTDYEKKRFANSLQNIVRLFHSFYMICKRNPSCSLWRAGMLPRGQSLM